MNIQSTIERIYQEVKPYTTLGQVADYIPALKKIDPNHLGISVHTLDQQAYHIGHSDTPFSIQSISKVFSLTLAYKALGKDLWKRLGKEPSGTSFNSLVQLEHEKGIPRNPFINAGALVISDIVLNEYRYARRELLELVRTISHCEEVRFNEEVARSEKKTGHRNAALAYLMKSYHNIQSPVEDVLDFYFLQCSLEMSASTLARSFLYLANQGVVPFSGKEILNLSQAKRISALMITSGLYNEAGDFAYRVGIPGKSGVGGGIVAIIPQKLSICVWAPALNTVGNSLAGIEALERFTTYTGCSVF